MLRYVNKPATLAGFIKYAGRAFARRVFGLDVRTAASRRYDLHGFEYHYKYLSRFMHFEKLLADIKPLTGSIVECGIGPGRSLFDFAVISILHNTPRHIIGFDTFCGIPDATPQDGRWNTHTGGTWSYPVDHVREISCLPDWRKSSFGPTSRLFRGSSANRCLLTRWKAGSPSCILM